MKRGEISQRKKISMGFLDMYMRDFRIAPEWDATFSEVGSHQRFFWMGSVTSKWVPWMMSRLPPVISMAFSMVISLLGMR